MYKSKRESAQRQSKGRNDLSQFGIFAAPNMDGIDDGDDDDPELEAELLSILSSGSSAKARPQQRTSTNKEKPIAGGNLDQMIAESLQDVPSDESSADEDDPSLLAELKAYTGEEVRDTGPPEQFITPPGPSAILQLLNERIGMYKAAEANAKLSADTAKARRLERGLKTLGELLRKAERGVPIDDGEIPLPVAVPQQVQPDDHRPLPVKGESSEAPPVPPRRSSAGIGLRETEDVLAILKERRDQYKKAAVAAKKAGDLETAKAHVRVIKQFESVISGVEGGEKVDVSSIPPPPEIALPPALRPAPPPEIALPPALGPAPPPEIALPPALRPAPPPPAPPPPAPSSAPASQPPSSPSQQDGETGEVVSVLDALEQRLAVFRKQEETAKTDGNSSKARRMGRIAKQYEDAIRLHKAGKEFPVDELPTPPGFPPIPVGSKSEVVGNKEEGGNKLPSSVPPPPSTLPSPSTRSSLPPPSPTSSTSSVSPKPSGRTTRQEKQLAVLLKRQKEWKEAAILAKKDGDLVKAKDCLRQAKGFDSLIEATRSGLPVDLTTIPVPPKDKLDTEFEIVNVSDCLPTGTNSEIYEQLKLDLKMQFKMCMETRAHYKALGDVANANKFEQLAVHTKKDWDRVIVLHEKGDPLPRFHYEMRSFSIVRSNTDLNDNDLELSIIQGVNYNVPNPKEIDTYVRYEFSFPSDDPKKDKTSTVYNTNNPQYNTTVIIPIVRSSRACQRVFKRHALKLEVWSKGGFLRSDTLIGSVNVKLQQLETKCTIHDSFNLMDGRKAVGGKVEVKLRLRHPIHEKEVEQVKEKWLLID